jgi:two-component system, NarL family, sensor kinase
MYLNISSAGWYLIGASILFLVLFFLFVLFYIMVKQKQNKLLMKEQTKKNEYEQSLLNAQIEIQSQTLQTISQEIHDNVGQVLSLARLNLATIEVPDNTPNQTKINDTKQLVSKAINDLRDLSRSLYGNKLAELGIADAVDNELKILQNSGQFKTSFTKVGEAFKLEPQKEMVIYRMLQESMNNAIKHSKAQNINVSMNYEPSGFRLCIADDGIGFNINSLPETALGMGLKSMQSRAALIGAKFSVQSSKNIGTSINIELPT